jgi:hypothetical protein
MRLLRRLLTPDLKALPRVIVQGAFVLVIGGAVMVARYVRRGFRWPVDIGGGP